MRFRMSLLAESCHWSQGDRFRPNADIRQQAIAACWGTHWVVGRPCIGELAESGVQKQKGTDSTRGLPCIFRLRP